MMAIRLTDNAVQHVKKILAKQPAIGLRLGTRKSGCTGFAYVVEFADELEEDDQVFESNGVKLVVDIHSLLLLDCMTVYFV